MEKAIAAMSVRCAAELPKVNTLQARSKQINSGQAMQH